MTSGLTDEVYRLDPETGAVVARFDLGLRRDEIDEPHGVAISASGQHWYATVAHGNPTLWKFELAGDRLVGRLALGARGAARVGLSPDGEWAFVPDYYRSGDGVVSEVAVVRTRDLHLVGRLEVCPAPHDAQVSPSSSVVAVSCALSDEIVLLDPVTRRAVHRFPVGAEPGMPGAPRYRPLNLVWTPDGDFIHATLSATGVLRTFSAAGESVAEATVGAGPAQLASTRDGRLLVTANRLDESVSVVRVERGASGAPLLTEVRRADLGVPYPHGIAITPDGATAFVTYEGTTNRSAGVAAVSVTDGRLAWNTEIGVYLLGVAYYEGRN